MKTGELLLSLLENAGMDVSDASLKDIASITTTIPDSALPILQSMMTAEQAIPWAKNNGEVKKHFFAQAYRGIDANIHETADNAGLDEATVQAIRSEKNTGQKQILLANALKDQLSTLKDNKPAGGKEVQDQYKAEIDKLQKMIGDTKAEYEGKLSEKDSFHKGFVLNSKIDSVLGQQKWSENYPVEMRSQLGKLAIENKLKNIGATAILDESGEIKFVRIDNPELEYFDNTNKKITFTSLAAQTLAENKFLAASTPTPNTPITNTAAASSPKTSTIPSSTRTALSESLKDQGL